MIVVQVVIDFPQGEPWNIALNILRREDAHVIESQLATMFEDVVANTMQEFIEEMRENDPDGTYTFTTIRSPKGDA